MKTKTRNLITIDLSSCKNWNECMKVMDTISSGRVKINVQEIKIENPTLTKNSKRLLGKKRNPY